MDQPFNLLSYVIFIFNFHLFYLFEIICLNTFLKFFNSIYVIFKLNILPNDAKYPKKLAVYYIIPFFTFLKSLYLMDHWVCWEKITLVQRKSYFV